MKTKHVDRRNNFTFGKRVPVTHLIYDWAVENTFEVLSKVVCSNLQKCSFRNSLITSGFMTLISLC